MPSDDGEEALEALAAALDDLVREAVREDLAGQRGDVHARALALGDVAEGLEVRVPPSHDGVAELEGGDVRLGGCGYGCRGWERYGGREGVSLRWTY